MMMTVCSDDVIAFVISKYCQAQKCANQKAKRCYTVCIMVCVAIQDVGLGLIPSANVRPMGIFMQMLAVSVQCMVISYCVRVSI